MKSLKRKNPQTDLKTLVRQGGQPSEDPNRTKGS